MVFITYDLCFIPPTDQYKVMRLILFHLNEGSHSFAAVFLSTSGYCANSVDREGCISFPLTVSVSAHLSVILMDSIEHFPPTGNVPLLPEPFQQCALINLGKLLRIK